jgi:hypothetical protein
MQGIVIIGVFLGMFAIGLFAMAILRGSPSSEANSRRVSEESVIIEYKQADAFPRMAAITSLIMLPLVLIVAFMSDTDGSISNGTSFRSSLLFTISQLLPCSLSGYALFFGNAKSTRIIAAIPIIAIALLIASSSLNKKQNYEAELISTENTTSLHESSPERVIPSLP